MLYILVQQQQQQQQNNQEGPEQDWSILHVFDTELNGCRELRNAATQWIKNEVGENHYQNTLDDMAPLETFADGLLARYVLENDRRAQSQQLMKQIVVFRKTSKTRKGWVYGEYGPKVKIVPVTKFSLYKTSDFTFDRAILSHKEVKTVSSAAQNAPSFPQVLEELRTVLGKVDYLKKISVTEKEEGKTTTTDPFVSTPIFESKGVVERNEDLWSSYFSSPPFQNASSEKARKQASFNLPPPLFFNYKVEQPESSDDDNDDDNNDDDGVYDKIPELIIDDDNSCEIESVD